ncbi:MAG: fibro-slime domain-containing protein [Clostridia bacterium]|nr:fibro-slime domain-containing protein [Clostridia bacterium]
MRQSGSNDAAHYQKNHRKNRIWKTAVMVLSSVVVFCTTYALILPAITMNRETICGIEEHIHTEECYQEQETVPQTVLVCSPEHVRLHTHTETCYDDSGRSICGYADFVLHTHNEGCYDNSGVLVCGLPEIEAHTHDESCYAPPHSHDASCYSPQKGALICTTPEGETHAHTDACFASQQTLVCSLEEIPAHHHTADCYVETSVLACSLEGEPDHVHDEACYTVSRELSCGKEETDGHTHSDACYQTIDVQVCGLDDETPHTHADACYAWESVLTCTQLTEEEGALPQLVCDLPEVIPHIHDETCFDADGSCICGLLQVEEHVHDSTCFAVKQVPAEAPVLICGKEEHQHSDACYPAQEALEPDGDPSEKDTNGTVYHCGLAEHLHSVDCFSAETGTLLCTMPEHLHSEECGALPGEPEDGVTELSYSGGDYTVSVVYGPEAGLPQGVTLWAEEILPDTEEYREYYTQSVETLDPASWSQPQTLVFARFFDVWFELDGEVYEPEAPVSVTITYDDGVEIGRTEECQAIHFAEDGPEILEVDTEDSRDGSTSFTHTQDGFSVVGTVVTSTAYSRENAAEKGPNLLPVDYYVCIDGEWICVGSTKTGWYNNYNGTEGWTNYNRDYITVAQAVSILSPYGLTGEEENPSRVTAYQQKSGNTKIYSDTDTVPIDPEDTTSQKILPLSRNADHAGYNLYYLPANTAQIKGVASSESLDKTANAFYTVKVFDAQGQLLTKKVVKTGGSFTYDATESGITNWLVSYGSGSTANISGSTIILDSITSTVIVSPKQSDVKELSHSVTFKVMIDGQWQTVGSLPYYYTGDFNGSPRAYITSDMAAQFFGDFGYTAATDPGYHFGYSYNDIYTLFYANGSTQTNFCMDVAGGTIKEAQVVQLYTSNKSDAQIFRIWDAGNGYSFITPIKDSSLHVNVYGFTTGDPSGTQLKLSAATNENSQWKVDTGSDGRTTFWSALAPTDQVIDLSNNNQKNGGKLQVWHSTGGARYWYLVQQYRISNDTASESNGDGTYKIGLTPESNGDIVCYYLPGEISHAYTDKMESDIDGKNSFWSVSVRDDTYAVYSDGELSGMVKTVAPGGEAKVTVRNGDGILWSVSGASDVTSAQAGGYTTFVIKNITQPVEVVATKANPTFTVQYYANIPRFATSGSNPLKVIDTSGKALPTNGGSMATRNIYLEGIQKNTTQNAGVATELYQVKTTTELTKMYTDGTFHYEESPGLDYFNKLKDNESYTLKEIWVLKAGKKADSTNRADWDIYTYSADTAFTNEAGQAAGNTILIGDGAVIRLVSDTSSGDYYNGTTFYDYDISSGYDEGWRTGITGINKEGNYGTSLNDKRNWRSGADILAFGNANCGTGMSGYLFDGGALNKANQRNPNYMKATFGLVQGLNSDGTIRYNDWIVAPKLFNEELDDTKVNGKQTYAGSSLTFERVGDTYTLRSATLKNYTGGDTSISGLQYFFHPSPASDCIWDGEHGKGFQSNIFTNNFWPMDNANNPTRKDANWGAYGNPGSFQGFAESNNYNWSDLAKDFPVSDDGRAHNWFFGMNFALNFNLTADYEGPLEYYFFGDDDLWVFLDNTLICDIGGVHSSIGEYVNLRDYLPVGNSGQHTLSFFYTERGASGSTCWMSFTLPSVTSATTARDTGSLQIAKSVEGGDGDYSKEEYKFKVELLTSENGSPLNQTFSYSRSDGTYGTIKSGGTIALKANDTVTISGIPTGTFYRVTEAEESRAGYKVTADGNEGYIASGKIETGAIKPASFVNTPYYELPSTGGGGTEWYTAGGLCLMAAAGLLYAGMRLRRKGGRDSP